MSNDDKTRIIRPLDQLKGPPPLPPGDNDVTRKMTDRAAKAGAAPEEEDYEKTQLVRPAGRAKTGGTFDPLAPAGAASSATEPAETDDPVVGWLVVTAGPGRGSSVQLGYGWNSI